MTRRAERLLIDGAVGKIEIVVDHAAVFPTEGVAEPARGIALVAHPHPLYGGTLDNKVAQTLARTFTELGYVAIRPNFRGVGASAGTHDHGVGETDDLVRLADWAQGRFGPLPVALAGFSFGAYVQARVARRLAPERMALVGVPDGLVAGERRYETELSKVLELAEYFPGGGTEFDAVVSIVVPLQDAAAWVEDLVRKSGVQEGLCLVNAMHITASVFINDAEDGLLHDYDVWLEKLAPFRADYRHHRTGETNGDSHLKNLLIGHQVVMPVTNGKLDLGPWQQVYYAEFDGQRRKRVLIKVIGE